MLHAGTIQTPTLVVHWALDHRCAVEQGEQFYMALKRRGVPTELVRFPNESHELSRAGRPWHRVFPVLTATWTGLRAGSDLLQRRSNQ